MSNQESKVNFVPAPSKEQLELASSLTKEPELVMSWLSCLTELEQMVLSTLYRRKLAMTTKEIRNAIISATTICAIHNYNIDFPFQSYYYLSKELKEKLREERNKKKGEIDLELIKKTEKIFKFPSFRRIGNTIKDLMNLKIIFVRQSNLQNKKVKGLYYLNPVIRTQIKKIEDKQDKEKKERRAMIDRMNTEIIKASGGKPVPLLNY